jgi:hypothetical protein
MIRHPLASIPKKSRPAPILVLLALTVALSAVLLITGEPLRTEVAPAGILSYEFAGSTTRAVEILDSWDEGAKSAAGFNLGLDYLYLLAYSTTIALAILWLTTGLEPGSPVLAAALLLAWGQWLAALLDALENVALVKMLLSAPADPWPAVAFICASIKFLLIALGLIATIAAAIHRLR